jgi:hypothetical protein
MWLSPSVATPRFRPLHRVRAVRVPGVRVVQPHHLQPLVAQRQRGVLVAQHLDVGPGQRAQHLGGAAPVVVVAQHADDGRGEAAHHLHQLVEIRLAVAHEVAGDDDEVGLLRVGERHGGHLHRHGRHAPHVLVGEVRHAQPIELLHVRRGPREPAQADAVARGDRGFVDGGAHRRHLV